MSTLALRFYGNRCCLETDEKINFGHTWKMLQFQGNRSLSSIRNFDFKRYTPIETAASLLKCDLSNASVMPITWPRILPYKVVPFWEGLPL